MADYTAKSSPRISRAIFRQALVNRSSPAGEIYMSECEHPQEMADELYNICVAWEVDPAIALAFFVHESTAGTRGYARKTKNWGNVRLPIHGALRDDGSFAYYSSWAVSLNAFCKLLRSRIYEGAGLKTVGQIIPRYAPAADNNVPALYIAAVNNMVATWERLSS